MLDLSIVVVEDDKQLLETSSKILAREVREVHSFNEPSEALAFIDLNKPDILITDIKMPNINGLELVRIIKNIHPELAVIVISAFSEPDYFMQAINLKINHFLIKPVDMDKLLELIESISKELEMKKELHEQRNILDQYKNIVDVSNNISITDKKGVIKYVNDRFCELSGYSKEELIGKPQNIVRHPDMPKSFFKQLWDQILDKKVWQGIIKNKRKDGSVFYVDTTISPFLDSSGEIVEFVSIKVDITSLILKKEELQRQIITDALTGLSNRVKLQDDLRENKPATLIVFDINRFKEINLLFGVEMGDEAILYMARTIQNLLSPLGDARLYRVSADQFIVYKEGNQLKEFEEFANKVNSYIEKNAFDYKGISFDIDFTCALVYKEHKDVNLLESVFDALESAKKEKKFLYIYDEKLSKQLEYQENFLWTKKIKEALKDEKIKAYFQPLYNIKKGSIQKYESLMRFIDEDGTAVSPDKFLKIAKRSTIYSELTKTMLIQACETFVNRKESVSVNFSIEDLLDEDTIDFLINTVKAYKMQGRIIAEVLESEGIDNFEIFSKVLSRLKENDIMVAVDDFGSGYSNFSYLINLDIDFLKIDGSLIKDLDNNKNSKILVKSIIEFARVLEIQTIAEFVYSEEVYNEVKELGVDIVQGYFISEPLPEPLNENVVIK